MSIFLKLGHVPWQTHRTNPFFPTPNSFSSINRYINIYRYDTRRSARDQRRFDTEVRHGGSTWVISEWRVRRGEEEAGFGRGGGGGSPQWTRFAFPRKTGQTSSAQRLITASTDPASMESSPLDR